MPHDRFELSRGHSRRSAWIVEDHNAPRAEDPVLYSFSSKGKARRFLTDMIAEWGNVRKIA